MQMNQKQQQQKEDNEKEKDNKDKKFKVKLGESDLNFINSNENLQEGGMLMGPNHPIFHHHQQQQQDEPLNPPSILPRGSVPTNARFDPISPIAPSSGSQYYSSGEPDFDELLPPGNLNPSLPQPHRKSSSSPSNFKPPFFR
jgi:hypothetical protein